MDDKFTRLTFSGSTSHAEICRFFGIDPEDSDACLSARIHGQIDVEYEHADREPGDLFSHAGFGRAFSTEWSTIGLSSALGFLLQVKQPVVKRVCFLTQMKVTHEKLPALDADLDNDPALAAYKSYL